MCCRLHAACKWQMHWQASIQPGRVAADEFGTPGAQSMPSTSYCTRTLPSDSFAALSMYGTSDFSRGSMSTHILCMRAITSCLCAQLSKASLGRSQSPVAAWTGNPHCFVNTLAHHATLTAVWGEITSLPVFCICIIALSFSQHQARLSMRRK